MLRPFGALVRFEHARGWLALLALCCLGPTPGDIGGCGQVAKDLDPGVFFDSEVAIECSRCIECQLDSSACTDACAGTDVPRAFPDGCFPLVHDGTVCLRALTVASCEELQKMMSDPPRVPTECNFCPPETKPGP
jgi:hypothetical protein